MSREILERIKTMVYSQQSIPKEMFERLSQAELGEFLIWIDQLKKEVEEIRDSRQQYKPKQ